VKLVLRTPLAGGRGTPITLGLAVYAPGEGSVEVIPVSAFPGFADQCSPYRPNWRSVVASVVIHVLAVSAIPILNRLLPAG
jgi:hypothetical protein